MNNYFQSTQALYGVDPMVLSKMSYEDALALMLAGLWKRKREKADAIFAATDGDEASLLQDELRKIMKAIELTDLKIEEIK